MRTTTQERSYIYIVGLRDDLEGYIKVGKCRFGPRARFLRGQLAKVLCPRGYKTRVRDPKNLRLVNYVTFATDAEARKVEMRFHKRHREWARVGEWYPAKRLRSILRYLRSQ